MRSLFALGLLGIMAAASAQEAADPRPAESKPAADVSGQAGQTVSAKDAEIGINILGDKEVPVGLFLAPWKTVGTGAGLDRRDNLLQVAPEPLERETFHRQVDYFETIADYRRLDSGGTAAP